MAFGVQRYARCTPRASGRGWTRARAAQVQAAAGRRRRPGTKAPRGACAEVTCCLRGRLRRPREGIGRKWCRASLENQFVPPLIGHFAPPLRESLGRCASWSGNGDPDRGGAALSCLRTLKTSLSGLCIVPPPFSLGSGLLPPLSAQASSIMRLEVELSLTPLLGDFSPPPPRPVPATP